METEAKIVPDIVLSSWINKHIIADSNVEETLELLRDELTATHELLALQMPLDECGMWSPDAITNNKTQDELMEELKEDLLKAGHGDGDLKKQRKDLNSPYDTSGLDSAEKLNLKKFHAARLQGAPIRDPPRRGILLKENTPFYIALAFITIFQTGEGDYWAFQHQREQNGLPVSLVDWFVHVLRHKSGRALRHPRFFYFALNTIMRNKAMRGKAYFVKQDYEGDAYVDFTPEELLRMSKTRMSSMLCAYETKMPGSAAEKMTQRSDLETMIYQIETETCTAAMEIMDNVTKQFKTDLGKYEKDILKRNRPDLYEYVLQHVDTEEVNEPEDEEPAHREMPSQQETERCVCAVEQMVEEHVKMKKCAMAGGDVPVHFVTLTCAIFRWQDLKKVLADYDMQSKAIMNIDDPAFTVDGDETDHKTLVQQYGAIVAYFCAMKLELLVKHVLAADDYFGVYEWGAGGILHLHLLRWLNGRGRCDTMDGNVPKAALHRMAGMLAVGHLSDLSEWDLLAPEKWNAEIYDAHIPSTKKEPLNTDSESDCDGKCMNIPPKCQDLTDTESECSWKDLPSDVEFEVDLSTGKYIVDDDNCKQQRTLCATEKSALAQLGCLLTNENWHASEIPSECKKVLCTTNCKQTRQMRRKYLARLHHCCHMHDRHSGKPFQLEPIYGEASSSGEDINAQDIKNNKLATSDEWEKLRLSSLNLAGLCDMSIAWPYIMPDDVIALQEVTAEAEQWLLEHASDMFHCITSQSCASARQVDT